MTSLFFKNKSTFLLACAGFYLVTGSPASAKSPANSESELKSLLGVPAHETGIMRHLEKFIHENGETEISVFEGGKLKARHNGAIDHSGFLSGLGGIMGEHLVYSYGETTSEGKLVEGKIETKGDVAHVKQRAERLLHQGTNLFRATRSGTEHARFRHRNGKHDWLKYPKHTYSFSVSANAPEGTVLHFETGSKGKFGKTHDLVVTKREKTLKPGQLRIEMVEELHKRPGFNQITRKNERYPSMVTTFSRTFAPLSMKVKRSAKTARSRPRPTKMAK